MSLSFAVQRVSYTPFTASEKAVRVSAAPAWKRTVFTEEDSGISCSPKRQPVKRMRADRAARQYLFIVAPV